MWSPDIAVRTSIGAVNEAAIVQGTEPGELEKAWLSLRESDIQGLPPGMQRVSMWVATIIFGRMIGTRLLKVPADNATFGNSAHYWRPFPLRQVGWRIF